MSSTKGSKNKATLEKIERYLAGDKSVKLPAVVIKKYLSETDASAANALENAMTMEEVEPKQLRSQPQNADPLDDVIPDDDQDEAPPWTEQGDVKPVYSDEVYMKLFHAGHLKPEEDAYLAALVNRTLDSGISTEQAEQPSDENHEDVFLSFFSEAVGATDSEEAKPIQEDLMSEVVQYMSPKPLKVPPIKIAKDKEEDTKEQTDTNIDYLVSTPSEPPYGTPEWTPFILSQLIPETESIVKKGQICPKCMGLKRLLEKYVGPIINVQNQVLVTPNRDNHGIYVVQVTVEVQVTNRSHPAFIEDYEDIINVISWSDVSQTWAHGESQSNIVTQNPVASCFTKALSRCIRSLLGLSGVYTSEEMTDVGEPLKSHDPDSRPPMDNLIGDIKPNQIRFITSICDKYGADVTKVMQEVLDYGEDCPLLTDLSAQDAKAVQMFINNFQTQPCPKHLRKAGVSTVI